MRAPIEFTLETYEEITRDELYEVLELRSSVFVVEQESAYPDLDGKDQSALHLLGRREGSLIAYARWYSKGEAIVLGRIVIASSVRGQGIGRLLIEESLAAIGDRRIDIHAQLALADYYRSFGWEVVGEPYDDHGVPHIEMTRASRRGLQNMASAPV
ncbi:MAG: GNAT family N-acetyltransferase [Thermoanaerobaculia bacterium]|nr:GNAT family N-acetyltransferase [Thermoanaerobaculia bacterium]